MTFHLFIEQKSRSTIETHRLFQVKRITTWRSVICLKGITKEKLNAKLSKISFIALMKDESCLLTFKNVLHYPSVKTPMHNVKENSPIGEPQRAKTEA
ncbi:hypothetical protein [Neobacillus drentensis]|uniref:hypothetical protein n=1 Tax=Neobacillus drentensis TaxID=220684 RepID=UPI002FFF615B